MWWVGKRMIKSSNGGVFLNVSTTYASTGSGYVTASGEMRHDFKEMTHNILQTNSLINFSFFDI